MLAYSKCPTDALEAQHMVPSFRQPRHGAA